MNNTIHNTPEGYTPYRIFVFVFPAIVDFSIIFTGIVCIIYHREKYTRRYTRALLWSTGFFFSWKKPSFPNTLRKNVCSFVNYLQVGTCVSFFFFARSSFTRLAIGVNILSSSRYRTPERCVRS